MQLYAIRDERRADPRMVALLAKLGLDGPVPDSPFDGTATREELITHSIGTEQFVAGLLNGFVASLDSLPGIISTTMTIKGVDGNDILLFIDRPEQHMVTSAAPIPCIYHMHGGGMALLEAGYPYYSRWRKELAALGVVVVGVEFRNAGGRLGAHPFPAGLNDCISGLLWINEHTADLGISKIVLNGESGGGNLVLATSMRARQLGITCIAGVYAQCPFISNLYDNSTTAQEMCPSLARHNGYGGLVVRSLDVMATLYTPPVDGKRSRDPLAWPLWASDEDLKGLPPHIISLNELDPLYDEGLLHYRALMRNGVTVACRTLHGTTHASELTAIRLAAPEIHRGVLCDIVLFAKYV